MALFSHFKRLTCLEQTLFGLPFMLGGVVLAFMQEPVLMKGSLVIWVFAAFMAARISGMAFNQYIDWRIDAENPRTQNRVIPQGKVSPLQASLIAWGSLLVFFFCCSQINFLCFVLSPFACFLLFIYSYVKRFSVGCHFVLGCIHFLVPFFSWIAVRGSIGLPAFFLGMVAFAMITGSDILYALQDCAFDRQKGLYSIPARWGKNKSLWLACLLHVLMVFSLVGVGVSAHLKWHFYGAPLLVGGMLYYFYKQKYFSLFFNAGISIVIFLFLLGEVLWIL